MLVAQTTDSAEAYQIIPILVQKGIPKENVDVSQPGRSREPGGKKIHQVDKEEAFCFGAFIGIFVGMALAVYESWRNGGAHALVWIITMGISCIIGGLISLGIMSFFFKTLCPKRQDVEVPSGPFYIRVSGTSDLEGLAGEIFAEHGIEILESYRTSG